MTRRRTWIVVGVMVGLVAVVVSIVPISSDGRFREFVAAMRAAGEPTTVKELYGPNPSADEDAVTEIAAALAGLEVTLGARANWPCGNEDAWLGPLPGLSPEQRDIDERFVERFRPFTRLVDRALDRPRCRFVLAEDTSGQTPQGWKRWQLQSDAVAVVLAGLHHDRDPLERAEACRTLLRLCLQSESWNGRLDDNLHELLRQCLSELRVGIERATWAPSRVRALVDGVISVRVLDRLRRENAHRRAWVIGDHVERLDDLSRLGMVASLQARWQAWGNREKSDCGIEPDSAKTLHSAEFWRRRSELPTTSFVRYQSERRRISLPEPFIWSDLYSQQTIDDDAFEAAELDAAMRLARIALAVAENRTTHGDFPASLADLAWAFPDGVPLDPFTDAPFVYAPTPTGVRIASAGRLSDVPAMDEAELRERCLVWDLKR